jgi:hypothetical protein
MLALRLIFDHIYRYISFIGTCCACFAFGGLCEGPPIKEPAQLDSHTYIPPTFQLRNLASGDGLALSIFFLFLFTAIYLLKIGIVDQKNKKRERGKFISISVTILLLGTLISEAISPVLATDMSARIAIVYLPMAIYFFYINSFAIGPRYRYGFDIRVFFPNFLVCVSSISMGITAQYHIEGIHFGDNHIMNVDTNMKFCWVVGIAQLLNLSLLAFPRSPNIRTYFHISIPLLVILISFAINIWFDGDEGKYGIAIYAMTYSLGLTQSIKHMSLLLKGDADQRGEALQFYFPAINWAMAVIPFGSLLMPTLFKELSYPPMLIYATIVLIGWQFTSNSNKSNPLLCYWIGVSLSIACISSFLASALGFGPVTKIFSNLAKVGDDYWLASILGTLSSLGMAATLIRLSKDILGLNLDYFFENIGKSRMYYEFVGTFMLSLTASLVMCVFNAVLWLAIVTYFRYDQAEKFFFQQRMTVSCFGALVICLLSILTLFLRRAVMVSAIAEAREVKCGKFPAAYAPSNVVNENYEEYRALRRHLG